ncbi:MFS transporter [Sphingomonas sanxanigenens]|uniref:Membrane protein n=1 Tax=Sphingomonas sanxanigenens DSM 19645 = NX02 TaxID=1123269 RepID=W0A3U0_9SPHN|nr:MFS transporter [Sphingomonas sanxanigenens]AHE51706.1 membrane protein [Sphingomonas sanxanigenens DSM 19645 = NX02]
MSSDGSRASRRRAVAAATIGNAFEWYDFSVFVLFAPFIAQAFFPDDDGTTGMIKALLTFAVGFVARPVGAVVIGYYGDRAGRKAALTLTFGLMALGTAIIALAPTHAMIGAAAPVIVLFGRLLQGLSAGGEIGGAAAFLIEHAPPTRRARIGAWLQASMAMSNILAALVAITVGQIFDAAAMASYGWRIPFLFGLLIVPIGIWLRATLDETPAFEAVAAQAPQRRPRIGEMLAGHGEALLRGFGISVLWGVAIYALVVFMPVHLQRALGYSANEALLASLAGNAVLAGTCFVSGALADRFGRRALMGGAAIALLVGAPLLMAALVEARSLLVLVPIQMAFCALVGLYSGAAPAILAELFPTAIRSTGTSISYNAAITLFAGFAPAIITWLAANGFGAQAPTGYVAAAALVGLWAIRGLPRRTLPAMIALDPVRQR